MQWIKLDTGIFENAKIRLLSAQADGDAMVNLWIRLLCVAGKDGRGILMLNETKPYDAAMLAVLFGKRPATVAKALRKFEELGMIETRDGVIALTGWEAHQNTEAMERVRAKSCERQRRYRERMRSGNAARNAAVTPRDAEDKETEPEEETEKDKEVVVKGTMMKTTPEDLIRGNEPGETGEAAGTGTDGAADAMTEITVRDDPARFAGIASAADAERGSPEPGATVNWVAKAIGLSKTARGELRDLMESGVTPGLVRRATEMSQDHGAGKWSYLRVILKQCAENGILTEEALNAHEERFQSERAPANRPAAAQNYQQHHYTENDFGPDFYFDPLRDYAASPCA